MELACRYYGLHTPLLYETTEYGYRVVPNQSIKRFGNRVFYNAYGLRSEPIESTPAEGVLRILCIGDSVTFGGTQTDQKDTYSSLLEDELHQRGLAAEVLNASAGGWAPENEEGWLRANGTFGARVVVFQLGTHDLFQHKAPSEIVGAHPQFPNHAPLLGLQELAFRYVLPRILGKIGISDPGVQAEPTKTKQDVSRTLASLVRMIDQVRAAGAKPVVMLVEQPEGLEPVDDLARFAKSELLSLTARLGVPLIRPVERLVGKGGERLLRDDVHPNEKGNRVIAQLIASLLAEKVGGGQR